MACSYFFTVLEAVNIHIKHTNMHKSFSLQYVIAMKPYTLLFLLWKRQSGNMSLMVAGIQIQNQLN